eukprot:4575224-Karenia_brevis.AAC.1
MPAKEWEHEVREALRTSLWQQVAVRRPDFDGIQHGIDRGATLALLNSRGIDDRSKGVLRSILAGA